MEFLIHRQFIADDTCVPACISYTAEPSTRFVDVFRGLIRRKYFPRAAGGVWVLRCAGQDLVSWDVARNAFYDRFPGEEPPITALKALGVLPLEVEWFPTPLSRALTLYLRFGGDGSRMEQAGFLREYESYAVSPQMEATWKENFG